MTHKDQRHFEIENRGAVLIVRVDGGPHALFGPEIANQLEELVDRVDHDSSVHAVVITFGSRPKGAVAAIKRSVYFGGSMSLSEGLHVERTEFLIADQSKEAQDLMIEYLATTDATGELPLYNRDTYARALESGHVHGRRSTDGA